MTTDEETAVIITELAAVVRDFRVGAEAYKAISGGRVDAHQAVTLSAGSFGVWLSAMCCLVMLAAMLVGGFWISREFNRIDSRFNDQTDTDSVQDAYIHKLRAEQPKKEKP